MPLASHRTTPQFSLLTYIPGFATNKTTSKEILKELRTQRIQNNSTIKRSTFPRQVAANLPSVPIHRRSVAFEEMESYLNLPRGEFVDLQLTLCSSRLDMNDRGSAIVSSGHHVQFYADQVRELGGEGGGRRCEQAACSRQD